jgi:hypothetical protein
MIANGYMPLELQIGIPNPLNPTASIASISNDAVGTSKLCHQVRPTENSCAGGRNGRSGPNVGVNNFYCHEIFRFDTKIRDM